MILRLYDRTWNEIMEGLFLRAEWFAECGDSEAAELIKELMKTLEQLGAEVMGGKIEGYRLTMTSPRKQTLELRVVGEDQ